MGPGPCRWRRLWWLGLATPLLAGLDRLPATPAGQALNLLDSQIQMLFFHLRGARAAPVDPVILAIDAESLELSELIGSDERRLSPLWRQMGPWPWPRALQAQLAASVLERGAARVLFNIEFNQPSRFGPADDQSFLATLVPWRSRVHLAARYGLSEQQGVELVRLLLPLPSLATPGLTTLLQTPQGVAEAVPGQDWIERNLAGFPRPHPSPMAFVAARAPVPAAAMGLNYHGPAGTLRQVPAWKILATPAGFWSGRTVLIGVTAPNLGDLQETPFGPQSGTEVQAVALANAIQAEGLWRLPGWGEALLFLLWGVGAAWGLGRGATAGRTLLVIMVLASLALLSGWGLWLGALLRLPLAALLLAVLIGGGGRSLAQSLGESRERAYLHKVLARRVSPTLLSDILRNPGPIWTQLVGSRARCVVLFSDLVDFTSLSTSLAPDQLFALLNRYFEAMAAAVLAEEGLLDKFIGDAVMAEFGVPRSRGDRQEARAAVRAALTMQRGLEQLNRELIAAGQEPLRHGIGLHVGEVIAGNLGATQRLEFTVVGTSVNVANRLERLTRRYPQHPILISAELAALLPGELEVKPLGPHQLKGGREPLEVLALLGLRDPAPPEPSESP
ncbi:adenylate/guanylate cyclase domain-containing protein [Synechococcus sp. CS-1325]|nr:adenylate/guanylate cyclase domain-containing protein [Synechococcus sp. CS-1325]MCT0212637.1 adenylate/guanylate cyclase domain-containing protein [Synechococcus sp. CS-1326]MCT0233646.1 adenylate/guanylate cyclase domain-containing protein [Synechococcus sp. CS-1327]PZV00598.1 MAG: adenylate/guanylate cyclase domain-containing protein [Cyanobium sp.]